MQHLGLRFILPVLAIAAVTACKDGGGRALGPDPLSDHTPKACDHDVTAPVIGSLSASLAQLWSPNHKLVPVTVSVASTDNCSAVATSIVSVSSSEPVDALGDGHTQPDW